MAASGFLVINKRAGWTSFDVVAKVRARLGGLTVGHAGTLDPFATGVLVLALGRARFLLELLRGVDKEYRGRVRLGQISDTDDVDGVKTSLAVATPPTRAQINLALAQCRGSIQQVPPTYAALRVRGHKMYELARRGIPFERRPRTVTIHRLDLLAYAYPQLDLRVRVSSGTYIRALARDLGRLLKTGAFLEQLVRERVGSFSLQDSVDVERVTATSLSSLLIPPERALEQTPSLVLGEHALQRLAHGESIRTPAAVQSETAALTLAALNAEGSLQMLVQLDPVAGLVRPHKIIDERWL